MHDLDRVQLEAADGYGGSAETDRTASMTWTDDDEMADMLLGVEDDAELDAFIGDIMRKAVSTSRRALRSDVGRSLRRLAKDAVVAAAKKGIPQLDKAIGRHLSGTTGARIGQSLASTAVPWLGTNGSEPSVSVSDSEREVAKTLVRFVSDATTQATAAPAELQAPRAAIVAATAAARRSSNSAVPAAEGSRRSGTWVRRGNRIVIKGV